MVQINFGQREVSCKVVFYGPGMSGKTTNLEIIHKKAPKDAVGEMVSIATETDRTLYFDFLPLDLGQVAGMRTKFQLYTVPGQIYYNATRKLVLQGVDGVIFVADSNPDKMAENLESLQNLRENLAEIGLNVDDPASQGHVPLVLQYNKRDLPNALGVPALNQQMNTGKWSTFEAVARDGKGVFATLKEISRLVIEKLNREHAPSSNRRRSASNLNEGSASPTPGAGPTPSVPTPARPSPVVSATPSRPANTVPPAPPPAAAARPVPQPLPPRPAAPPASAPAAPRPAVAAPPRPSPAAPAPAAAAPPPAGNDPRNRHLQKAKPPSLDHRAANPPQQVGTNTDPSLRRYQDAKSGGSSRIMSMAVLGLLGVLLLLVILAMFVPAVRAQLPMGIQKLLDGGSGEPAAPTISTPAPASQPTITPAPAPSPAPVPTPAASTTDAAKAPDVAPAPEAATKPADATPAPGTTTPAP